MKVKTVLGILVLAAAACHHAETPATDSAAKPATPPNVRTQVVALSTFQRTIETTGTVAFNQTRSTQVLSPISGPVARILVAIGTRVSRGEALAVVASPDFAVDISALRKAEATARNTRRIASLDEQLFKNDAIAR
ncbi:MAG TPA: efflux RND transporter periplasmic adaptor subunit, partial [Thermoanaerobaculia bacterium]|nr:efflux RND transporter periplasmic adaptor subunit [Thermoanaerobaculia bacterium]